MAYEHSLRIITLLTTALATPLNIGTTVASLQRSYYHYYYGFSRRRHVTTWCFVFIPLAITAAASVIGLLHHRKHGRMPDFRYMLLDLTAATMYLGLLISIWAIEIGALVQPGLGLLAGYTTAPMIVNMFVHFYIFLCSAKLIGSWLFKQREHECPNCHSKFVAVAPPMQQASRGGEGYSLLRGEEYLDEDAAAYTDVRTPEDQIRVEGTGDVEADKVTRVEDKAALWTPVSRS